MLYFKSFHLQIRAIARALYRIKGKDPVPIRYFGEHNIMEKDSTWVGRLTCPSLNISRVPDASSWSPD